jgi:hypothetical protein
MRNYPLELIEIVKYEIAHKESYSSERPFGEHSACIFGEKVKRDFPWLSYKDLSDAYDEWFRTDIESVAAKIGVEAATAIESLYDYCKEAWGLSELEALCFYNTDSTYLLHELVVLSDLSKVQYDERIKVWCKEFLWIENLYMRSPAGLIFPKDLESDAKKVYEEFVKAAPERVEVFWLEQPNQIRVEIRDFR